MQLADLDKSNDVRLKFLEADMPSHSKRRIIILMMHLLHPDPNSKKTKLFSVVYVCLSGELHVGSGSGIETSCVYRNECAVFHK